jgi:hypothetical protein
MQMDGGHIITGEDANEGYWKWKLKASAHYSKLCARCRVLKEGSERATL